MKKKEKKVMKAKLFTAIKQVLKVNNAFLSDKAEATLKKSIKQIVKKTDKKRKDRPAGKNHNGVAAKGERKTFLSLDKIKMDGAAVRTPNKRTSS